MLAEYPKHPEYIFMRLIQTTVLPHKTMGVFTTSFVHFIMSFQRSFGVPLSISDNPTLRKQRFRRDFATKGPDS